MIRFGSRTLQPCGGEELLADRTGDLGSALHGYPLQPLHHGSSQGLRTDYNALIGLWKKVCRLGHNDNEHLERDFPLSVMLDTLRVSQLRNQCCIDMKIGV